MMHAAALVFLVALWMSGCGGGSSAGPPPTATLDSTSLVYAAFALDQNRITVTPDPKALSFMNFTSGPFVKVSAPTTGGIESVHYTETATNNRGGLTFTFVAPSALGAGQHATLVDIKVCTDSDCTNEVASFGLTVTYLVTETLTVNGANGYTMTALTVPHVQSIAGNAQQSDLFFGIASDAGASAAMVGALDPVSGIARYSSQKYGSDIVLSGDGATLYAWCGTGPGQGCSINQLSLGSLTPTGLSLTLGWDVDSVAVAPGAPQTLAVSFNGASWLWIFDGTVPRPSFLGAVIGPEFLDLQWLQSDTLYWLNDTNTPNAVNSPQVLNSCITSVDTGGLAQPPWICNQNPLPFNFANGLGYGESGQVVNPLTWATVATLSLPIQGTIESAPLPDAALSRLFVIEQTPTGTGCRLQSFTLTTLRPIASLDLPVDASGHCLDEGSGLVRFGTKGLAFTATGASSSTSSTSFIVTITGAFVSG